MNHPWLFDSGGKFNDFTSLEGSELCCFVDTNQVVRGQFESINAFSALVRHVLPPSAPRDIYTRIR